MNEISFMSMLKVETSTLTSSVDAISHNSFVYY